MNPQDTTTKPVISEPMLADLSARDQESRQPKGSSAALDDPRLTALINSWETLPEAIKSGIGAMVEAARKRPEAH